jgi:hypothetical protein
MPKLSDRGERLLLQALHKSQIQNPNASNRHPPLIGGTSIYWHRVGDEIEIVFNCAEWFTGRLCCSITLSNFTETITRLFPDDPHALSALVEMIKYLRGNLELLLSETSRGLYLRSQNLLGKQLTAPQRLAIEAVESMIIRPMAKTIDNRFKQMNKQLRAAPGPGGSNARLEQDLRQSMHEQYDEVQRIAKPVRKSYLTIFKTFETTHSRSGYKWAEWQEFWIKYATELTGHEAEFLLLFAERDSQSASEVAYRWLVAQTGHTRSYVQTLVIKSRKEAGKSKRRKD